MPIHEAHQLVHHHMNRFVKVTMNDGRSFRGYIVKVEGDHVILAVPHEYAESMHQTTVDSREERFFPFFWLALPLAFVAGLAVRGPYPYPCPVYPCAAYPYPPYYPYGYPGYGYY